MIYNTFDVGKLGGYMDFDQILIFLLRISDAAQRPRFFSKNRLQNALIFD